MVAPHLCVSFLTTVGNAHFFCDIKIVQLTHTKDFAAPNASNTIVSLRLHFIQHFHLALGVLIIHGDRMLRAISNGHACASASISTNSRDRYHCTKSCKTIE